MQKINFQNLPNTTTPINATNLNAIQNNAESAINDVAGDLSDYVDGTSSMGNINTTGVNINNTPIIESGSNTNGNYIKYEDGTLIQWNTISVTDQSINSQYGDSGLYTGQRTVIFPIPFINTNYSAFCGNFRWGTSASWGQILYNNQATWMTLIIYDFYSRAAGTNTTVSWIAIGRWK